MPYGEKLNSIKENRKLTNSQISKICDVSLSTVTRVFDEKNLSGNFETFVSLAKGLNFSLDELAGLKPPAESSTVSVSAELLKEKDERLREKDETIKSLIDDKIAIRKEKNKAVCISIAVTLALGSLVIAFAILFIIDLLNGHMGHFRY
jgi:transcriptional regulator with XRE-family HTH domain